MNSKLWKQLFRHNTITEAEIYGGVDGLSKQQAVRNIHKQVDPIVKGFFKDEYWKPIHDVWKKMEAMDLDVDIIGTEYYKTDAGMTGKYKSMGGVPAGKIWTFEINFINNRQKKNKIRGRITAAGAGSVQDPLDKYDVTITMS